MKMANTYYLKMTNQKILIYDLETSSVDVNVAIPAVMGYYSSEKDEFGYTTDIAEMCDILANHDVIVGYNHIEYDNKIMTRYGADFLKYKINVDLMQIIHGKGFGNDLGRKTIIKTEKGILNSYLHSKSLEATSKALGGPEKLVGEVDYNWFKQDFNTLADDVKDKALAYLKVDLEATKFVYIFLETYFKDFKDGCVLIKGEMRPFMTPRQVERKVYLTASVASWTYKVLCNLADIEERYPEGEVERQSYGGGFVATPAREITIGNIYCLDYSSLYPHIMIMNNLYGRVVEGYGYKGEGVHATIGTYNNKQLSPVCEVLKLLYNQRLEYKKEKDTREYTIKIIINTIYGLLGNPSFASIHDYVAAADCTQLGRQWINCARKHFMELGYDVIYTDTDSIYLADPFNNRKKLIEAKDAHIAFIKSKVPFPVDTFDMGIEDGITFLAFEKRNGELLKKHYMYMRNGKLTVKGMDLVKSTSTRLGQLVFERYIKPSILRSGEYKFTKKQIEAWMEELLREDKRNAAVFYKIKNKDFYAVDTQIHAQIAAKYGEGQYNIVKLRGPHAEGIGVGKNYVDVDRFGESINLRLIDVSKTFSELQTFIKDEQTTLGAFV